MSIFEQLASSQGRRDEVPNQLLAESVVKNRDNKAVRELVTLLEHKNSKIRNDAIKVLYEVGGLNPALIEAHGDVFCKLLRHKDNRLQWGGMTALSTIVNTKPGFIFQSLPKILDAADQGSVITKDQAANILIKLAGMPSYADEAFSLLLELIHKSAPNQFPMYAERTLPVLSKENTAAFIRVLQARLPGIEKESQQKRIEKILKQLK